MWRRSTPPIRWRWRQRCSAAEEEVQLMTIVPGKEEVSYPRHRGEGDTTKHVWVNEEAELKAKEAKEWEVEELQEKLHRADEDRRRLQEEVEDAVRQKQVVEKELESSKKRWEVAINSKAELESKIVEVIDPWRVKAEGHRREAEELQREVEEQRKEAEEQRKEARKQEEEAVRWKEAETRMAADDWWNKRYNILLRWSQGLEGQVTGLKEVVKEQQRSAKDLTRNVKLGEGQVNKVKEQTTWCVKEREVGQKKQTKDSRQKENPKEKNIPKQKGPGKLKQKQKQKVMTEEEAKEDGRGRGGRRGARRNVDADS